MSKAGSIQILLIVAPTVSVFTVVDELEVDVMVTVFVDSAFVTVKLSIPSSPGKKIDGDNS